MATEELAQMFIVMIHALAIWWGIKVAWFILSCVFDGLRAIWRFRINTDRPLRPHGVNLQEINLAGTTGWRRRR